MPIEKHSFLEGMDGDTSTRLVSDKAVLNLMNARVGVTENGRNYTIQNLMGTTQIAQSVYPPYGANLYLGSTPDVARNRILYAIYNTFNDHAIYCLDYSIPSAPIIYAVCYDSQVINGLGFSKSFRIDRNARVNGDLLYYTDNNNEPKRINIEAGIKMNHASYITTVPRYEWPMNPEVITLIRRPPNIPLIFTKRVAADVSITLNTNQIKNNAFRFTYKFKDRFGEETTFAEHSLLAPFNYPTETNDIIEIRIPLTQIIDQYVQSITIVVIYQGDEKGYSIKTWDRNNATDLAEINAHNNLTAPLTYYFTNNEIGENIDRFALYKPFDVIPIKSKSLEIAQSRLHLANNLLGYTTPNVTSLDASIVQVNTGSGTVAGNWTRIEILYYGYPPDPGNPYYYSYYLAYFPTQVDATHPAGYYDLTATAPLGFNGFPAPPFPSNPINIANYTYIGLDLYTDVFQYIDNNDDAIIGFQPTGYYFNLAEQLNSISTNGTLQTTNTTLLKTGSGRRLAIVFYDKYMRQCGVVPCPDGLITIPKRSYVFSATYNYAIQWTLDNTNALIEIPDWAYFYSIVSTKDLTRSFFMQSQGFMRYATKNATGTYDFTTTAYNVSNAGVGIRLDVLQGYGLGYSFNEGDIIDIYTDNNLTATLAVLAQQGDWVVAGLHDFGNVTGIQARFEIYTPGNPAASQFYYEQGTIFPIQNPTLSSRQYSTTQGQIAGDIYLLTRSFSISTYVTENMSPNDTYWKFWYTNAGRVQIVDTIGQQRLKTGIRWSNTFIAGTTTNGLSSFDALDQKILQPELNEINKLQLANKIDEQGQGNVMLAICTTETVSMYLSEVQLMAAAIRGDVATSDKVIGSTNVLKGSYGTINPESVVEYLGLVFWIDTLNGCAVQYSNSGLDEVSGYKEKRFFHQYLLNYLNSNANNLDNINGFHHLPTCVNPFHKEFICSLPGLIYPNYASVLPSYSSVPSYATSIIDRFDIYDQLAKTMAFSFLENKWGSNYEPIAEGYDFLQNTMFAWKNGVPYIHEHDSVNWNNIYGTQYPIRVCLVANYNPSLLKNLADISIEGNSVPDFTVGYANYPDIQITDLTALDYKDQEGNFYASFLRDRLSPNATGTADQRLYTGDQLKDIALKIMCEWQAYSSLVYINFINLGWESARGQQEIAKPVNG